MRIRRLNALLCMAVQPMQPTQPITSRELRKAVSQARRCDDESCIALVRACDSIDGGNANGKTALMLAAEDGHTSDSARLLELAADTKSEGSTF